MTKIYQKKIFISPLLILIIISGLIIFLKRNRNGITSVNKGEYKKESILNIKYKEIKFTLINKKIESIRKILKIDINELESPIIVMVYNGFDCESCIKKAIEYLINVKRVEEKEFYIIASNTSANSDQVKFNLENYIFYDSTDSIRRELKFIPTPIILFLNKKYEVLDVYFPR